MISILFCTLLFLSSVLFAQEKLSATDLSNFFANIQFKSFVEGGRFTFNKGGQQILASNEIYHYRAGLVLSMQKQISSVLSSNIEVQWIHWRNQKEASDQFHLAYIAQDVILQSASFSWDLSQFTLDIGIIDYKYTLSKNLGEYLYRSRSYPTVIFSSQTLNILKESSVKVLGISLKKTMFNGRIQHVLNGFLEQEQFPVYDFTPSYHLYYEGRFFRIGGGISLDRVIHFREVIINSDPTTLDSIFDYDHYDQFIEKTKIDNFSSTKLSAQFMVNLGNLLGNFFQRQYQDADAEQFLLYGELAVLGWKNHAPVYRNRWQRTPIMGGLNLPLSVLLPLTSNLPSLNFELEYLKNPYGPGNLSATQDGVQFVPKDYGKTLPTGLPYNYERDDWKWSFLMTQPLGTHLNFKVRVSSDHFRTSVPYNREEALGGDIPLTSKAIDYLVLVRLEWTN